MIKTVITDGGKPDGLLENNMDCTVRALAIAGNIGYAAAYILMEQGGRMPGKSAPIMNGLNEFVAEGFGRYRSGLGQGFTVSQFIHSHPKGRYILRLNSDYARIKHVVSVIDGVVLDDNEVGARKRVLAVWEIIPS